MIHFLLDIVIGERNILHRESSIQPQLLIHRLISWRQIELRLELYIPRHHWWFCLHTQLQKVLDTSFFDRHIELDVMAGVALRPYDIAGCSDIGV